ncbi:hypothetical protein FACS1894219_10640 [Clostridia bacterium]|nr:hypothetical protein FACS1894219_10640 [Clostridia bacterium]
MLVPLCGGYVLSRDSRYPKREARLPPGVNSIGDDIQEYNFYATRRLGEISAGLEKAVNQYSFKSACPGDGQAFSKESQNNSESAIPRHGTALSTEKTPESESSSQFGNYTAPRYNFETMNNTAPKAALTKKETLAESGIDIRRANEAEKFAAIPEAIQGYTLKMGVVRFCKVSNVNTTF